MTVQVRLKPHIVPSTAETVRQMRNTSERSISAWPREGPGPLCRRAGAFGCISESLTRCMQVCLSGHPGDNVLQAIWALGAVGVSGRSAGSAFVSMPGILLRWIHAYLATCKNGAFLPRSEHYAGCSIVWQCVCFGYRKSQVRILPP